jgi:CheY-like chemotaxis protein
MPDVLVSDIAMPDMDGYALLRELHRRFGRELPRVAIAVTAHATSTDRDLALAAGFDGHVSKPFDPGAFVELVRNAARKKDGRA